jgi:hypothetical protein
MKKFAKLKFWSFLVFGLLFLFAAAFLYATGRGESSLADFSLLAGLGSLIIFTVILFYLYKGKIKEARKD